MIALDEALKLYGLVGIHPAAEIFPMMSDLEATELAADAKEHGWHHPIVATPDGLLLDGRNRLIASVGIQLDVPVRRLNPPDPISWVISENMQRRHLTVVQKADAAARATALRERLAEQAKARQVRKPADSVKEPVPEQTSRQARDEVGQLFGVSGKTVDNMRAVQQQPDLHDQVISGTKGIAPAAKEARERTRAAAPPEKKPQKPKPSQTLLTLRTNKGEEVQYPKPASKATFNETAGDGISWAAWSWNPVTGCLHGCTYCYARDIATSDRFKASYPVGFTPLFHHERLDAPANTAIPAKHRDDLAYKRVFVCSMADLYGQWVPDEWVSQVHASMCANPQWQYITLTKFPTRYTRVEMPPGAWVGTSVDEQKRVRIAEDAFRNIKDVQVKWLSLEPLLAPLEFTDLSMFDWVVIGAQTQTRQPHGVVPAFAPPFEWVSRIVAQAREAGCRIHQKPNLLGRTNSEYPGMQLLNEYPDA